MRLFWVILLCIYANALTNEEVLNGIEGRVRIITNNYAPAIIHISGKVTRGGAINPRIDIALDYKKKSFNPLNLLLARSDKEPFTPAELSQIRTVIIGTIGTSEVYIQNIDFDEGVPQLYTLAKAAAGWSGIVFVFFLLCKLLFGRKKSSTYTKVIQKEEYYSDDDDEYIEINDFEELARAADSVLLEILEKADREQLLVALKGSSDELTSRFLSVIDQKEVGKFIRQLENVADVTLKDVLEAQGKVLNSLM